MPTVETLRALNSIGLDVAVLLTVTLRKADDSFVTLRLATRACDAPDGNHYFAAIADPGVVTQPGKYLSADVGPCTGSVRLVAAAHAGGGLTVRDYYSGGYIWLGSSVEMSVWEKSTSETVTTLRAVVAGPDMKDGYLTLTLRQRLDWNRSIVMQPITREQYPGAPEESIGGSPSTLLGRLGQLPARYPPFAHAYDNSEDISGASPLSLGMGNGMPFVAGGRRLAKGLLVDAGRGVGSARVLMASHRLSSLGDLTAGTPLFITNGGDTSLITPSSIFNDDSGAGFLLDDGIACAFMPLYPSALDEAFVQERNTITGEVMPPNARAILDRWNDASPVVLYEGTGQPRRVICTVRTPSGSPGTMTAMWLLVAADCSVPRSFGSSQTSILPFGWCHDGDSGPSAVGACYAGDSRGVAQWWRVAVPLPTIASDEDENDRWGKLASYRLCFGDFTTLFVDSLGSRWPSAFQTAMQGQPRLYCAGLVAQYIPAQETLIAARTITPTIRPEGTSGPYTVVLKDVPAVTQLKGQFFGNVLGQPDDASNTYTGEIGGVTEPLVPASSRRVSQSQVYATTTYPVVATAAQMSDLNNDSYDQQYIRSSSTGHYPTARCGISWIVGASQASGITNVRFIVRMKHIHTGSAPTKNNVNVYQERGTVYTSDPYQFTSPQTIVTGDFVEYVFDAPLAPGGVAWTPALLSQYPLGWLVDMVGGNTNTSYGDTYTVSEFRLEVTATGLADRVIERPCDLARYVLAGYGGEGTSKFTDDFVAARSLLRDRNGRDMVLGLAIGETVDVMTVLAWLNSNALTWTFLSPSLDEWRFHVWHNPDASPTRRISLGQFIGSPSIATTFDSGIAPSLKVGYDYDGQSGSPMHEASLTPTTSIASHLHHLLNSGSLKIESGSGWLDFYGQNGPTLASVQVAAGDHEFGTLMEALHTAIRAAPVLGLRWAFGFGGHVAWRSHILDFYDVDTRGAGLNTTDTSETEHSMDEYAAIVAARMNANTSSKGYECSYDSATGRFTISHPTAFSLLFGTGTHAAGSSAHSAAAALGFIPEDKTGAASYTSDFPIRAGQFALSSNGYFALLWYSGTYGYGTVSPAQTCHTALGFAPYSDGPCGSSAGMMRRFTTGLVPKTRSQAALANVVSRYIAATADSAARRDVVLDGRCLYDGDTVMEVIRRLADLLGRPHVVVRGTVMKAFGMERGEVIDFDDDLLTESPNPEPDGDGSWEGKPFVVVEVQQHQGPDSLAVEFTAVSV